MRTERMASSRADVGRTPSAVATAVATTSPRDPKRQVASIMTPAVRAILTRTFLASLPFPSIERRPMVAATVTEQTDPSSPRRGTSSRSK